MAAYFEAYAQKFDAPIHTGVEVKKVLRNSDRPGFTVETSAGVIQANRVVCATGPVIPPIASKDEQLTQIHSAQQLPDSAVLMVGAGSSGVQAQLVPIQGPVGWVEHSDTHHLQPIRSSHMPSNSASAIDFQPLSAYPGLATDPQSKAADLLALLSGSHAYTTVACGPGSMEQGHKPDEFVSQQQLDGCDAMLMRLADWLQQSNWFTPCPLATLRAPPAP